MTEDQKRRPVRLWSAVYQRKLAEYRSMSHRVKRRVNSGLDRLNTRMPWPTEYFDVRSDTRRRG